VVEKAELQGARVGGKTTIRKKRLLGKGKGKNLKVYKRDGGET